MRHIATTIIAALVASLTFMAPAAHARPDCGNIPTTKWTITNVSKSFKATGVYSNWVHPKHGSMTISYSKSANSAWTGTLSTSITAEAGLIAAKVSATAGVSVAKTWSKTQTWSYSATVKKDPKNQYRLRQRQETRKFTATKYYLSASCSYIKQKSGTGEMPRQATSSLVWDTQKRAA